MFQLSEQIPQDVDMTEDTAVSPRPTITRRPSETREDFLARLSAHPQVVERQQAKLAEFLARLPEPQRGPFHFPSELERERAENEVRLSHLISKSDEKSDTSITDIATEIRVIDLHFMKCFWYWQTFRINELPAEIFGFIFRTVVWSVDSPAQGVQSRCNIMAVCQQWRRISISDVTLWNSIWFLGMGPWHLQWEYLQRARAAALDIRINTTDPGWTSLEEEHSFKATDMEALVDNLFCKVRNFFMCFIPLD